MHWLNIYVSNHFFISIYKKNDIIEEIHKERLIQKAVFMLQ